MRTAGLFALAILLPAFAHAANPPALTAYTVSHDTIYPTATAESGLATTTAIDIAFSEKVKASIKIVSPGGTEIQFYSSQGVTDPNPRAWNGTNADGVQMPAGVYTILISATSFNDPSLALTDSSKTITIVTSGSSSDVATSTPSTTTSSGGTTTYTPPPSVLSVVVSGNQTAMLEVPLHLSARVTTKGGAVDSSAQISWSFGDGSSATGIMAEKTYRYAGTYLVVVTATDGSTKARDELVVTVRPVKVRLLSVSGDGITIANDSSERLDLSGWRLLSDTGLFRIPDGTTILPEASVLFPFTIMNLPITFDATLTYPDGIVAARSAPPSLPVAEAVVQLSEPAKSSNEVKTVGYDTTLPASNINLSGTAHEITTVSAPAATTELAAAGAALPSPVANRTSSLFRSPWTLGLLGIIAMAGGAFILL